MPSKPAPDPLPPSGKLLFATDIAIRFFGGGRSAAWVRRNVAPDARMRLGHSTVCWLESDVIAWFHALRGA